jgi:hypothetical protein
MAKHLIGIALIIGTGLLAYYPGLADFMLADDIPNIASNPGIQLTELNFASLAAAAAANESGPLGRPIASLSFGLNYYFSGLTINPSHFKATNLFIHLFNGLLVYLIAIRLFRALGTRGIDSFSVSYISLFIALIWTLHPIQLTSILYSVQRMTSLAALFTFAGLLLFLYGRDRLASERPHAQTLMYGGILSGTLLGALCKENALLLPFLALAVEATLFKKAALSAQARRIHKRFYFITVMIPLLAGITLLISHPEFFLKGYEIRNFTLLERLLTESRVLFYYLQLILYPDPSQLSLYHDDYVISRALLSPWTTLTSLISAFLLLLAAFTVRKKYEVFSFMVLWFFIGHAMESSIFPLEIAYEHRNYLPSLGIIFGVTYYLFSALGSLSSKKSIQLAVPIVIVFSLLLATHTRATIWSEEGAMAYFDLRNHPDSARSRMMYARNLMLSQGDPVQAYDHIRIATKLDTFEIGPILNLFKLLKTLELDLNNLPQPDNTTQSKKPEHYFDPIYLEQEYIASLAHLLDQEIKRRLASRITTTRAAMALRDLSICITQGYQNCTNMAPLATNWFALALENPYLTPKSKAVIYLYYAKLNAYNGHLDKAFTNLDKAIEILPEDLYIVIDKINLFISLSDWDNAKALIETLEQRKDLSAHHRKALDKEKTLYLSYREKFMNEGNPPQK